VWEFRREGGMLTRLSYIPYFQKNWNIEKAWMKENVIK
jgi:hypothetical protein